MGIPGLPLSAAAIRPIVLTAAYESNITTDLTGPATYSFPSVTLGDVGRKNVIVVASADVAGTTGVDEVRVAGNVATLVVDAGGVSSGVTASMYRYETTLGGTVTIEVDFTQTTRRCAIQVWTIENYKSVTPTDTDFDNAGAEPFPINLNIDKDGVAIAGVHIFNRSTTFTWAGLDEDFDTAFEISTFSGASKKFDSAQTDLLITADAASSTSITRMVGASFR